MNTKKGYIGAIGDDLPSLIPIFVGLTIFFAVFLNTYNIYRNNTDLYSLRNDAINISGILKEEPLIADQNRFIKTCARINTKYSWNALVTPLDLNSQNYRGLIIDDLDVNANIMQHWAETDRRLICNDGLDILKNALKTKEVTVYKYPITVQQQYFVEPAWLYVFVWK